MRVRSAVLPSVFALALIAAPAFAGGGVECLDCYRHVVTPPLYGAVAEKVMVRAPRTIAHTIPGQYGTVAEKVMIAPPRKVWQAGRDPYGRAIGCWVLLPAQYAVQHRTVMVRTPQGMRPFRPPMPSTIGPSWCSRGVPAGSGSAVVTAVAMEADTAAAMARGTTAAMAPVMAAA
jgi:hypothetical protein